MLQKRGQTCKPYKYMAIGSYSMEIQALLKGRAVPELATGTQHAGKCRQSGITKSGQSHFIAKSSVGILTLMHSKTGPKDPMSAELPLPPKG